MNEEEKVVVEETESQKNKGKEKVSGKQIAAELLIYVGIILISIFVIPKYVVQRTIVNGRSMENTLEDGDNLLVEKVSYRFSDPKRFDVIVFYPYGRESDEYYVKRVIGLPGETIQIINDDIYIDGNLIEEDYGKESMQYSGLATEPLKLSDDEFFVLGDNRRNSLDSRYSEVGPVERSYIEGRVVLRIYPFNKIKSLTH